MLRDSLSLAWQLGLGALTLVAGLGSVARVFLRRMGDGVDLDFCRWRVGLGAGPWAAGSTPQQTSILSSFTAQ